MSFLTYALIDGFMGRKKPLKIKFSRNLNVIFGLNGAGKTSLLQILDSAMAGRTINRGQLLFDRAEIGIFSENLDREIVRIFDFKQGDEASNLVIKYSNEGDEFLFDEKNHVLVRKNRQPKWVSLDVEDSPTINWNHAYLPITRLFGPMRSSQARLVGGDALDSDEQIIYEMFEEGLNRTWLEFYNRLLSKIQKTQQEGLANVFQEVFNSSKHSKRPSKEIEAGNDVLYSKVKRFLGRQASNIRLGDEESFVEKISDPLLRRVSARIYDVEAQIESFSQPVELLKAEIEKLFHGDKTIQFDAGKIVIKSKNGTQIKLSKLSSGEKNLLKILIELFKIDRSSLFIDEPELSMHIDWQRNLLTLFHRLNPHAQLVLATHSPEILSSAEPNEIIEI